MEKVNRISIITLLALVYTLSLVSAGEISIDISGLKSEEYTVGENINFNVILLDDGIQTEKEVEIELSDALAKKKISKTTTSNIGDSINIENDFPSGLWIITAIYADAKVERTFTVKENSEIEFIIENDELKIINNGNVRYTKTIQIKIGDETNSYAQNIGIGEEKRLKLISPKGTYDIEVTDGDKTISKESVQLFGTGNVVGAVDIDLVGYSGLAGITETADIEDRAVFLDKLPLSVVFVAIIGVLGVLVAVERKLSKKKNAK
ncbi:MAG: hypothetical protein ABIF88_01870 [archaeon]